MCKYCDEKEPILKETVISEGFLVGEDCTKIKINFCPFCGGRVDRSKLDFTFMDEPVMTLDKWLETEEGQFWETKAHQDADNGDGYYDDLIQTSYAVFGEDNV